MLPKTVFVKFVQEGDESWLEAYDSLEGATEKWEPVVVGVYKLVEKQTVKVCPQIVKVTKVKQR